MEDAAVRRTLLLTERVPRVCRLRRADADFLLATQRGRLELLPTRERHAYQITALGYVGVVVAATCRVVIRPKIPLRNFYHLLDPNLALPADGDAVAPGAANDLLRFLAAQFLTRLRERLAAGLQRGYRERAQCGPLLQGRLDVIAQARDAGLHKEQLHSQLDDFTTDVPCNRIVRATVERLAAAPLLEAALRAELRQTLPSFAEVQAAPMTAALLDVPADARTAEYGPLLDLCRLLLAGLGCDDRGGPLSAPAFLLDMERVFERYMTRGICSAFAGSRRFTVAVQKSYPFHQPRQGRPDLLMRPDVALERDGRPCLLVDSKWKRPGRDRAPTADLYQMLAYAAGLGVERAVLVYPGRRDGGWDCALLRSPIRVESRLLRVTGTAEECRRSLRRLGRRLGR